MKKVFLFSLIGFALLLTSCGGGGGGGAAIPPAPPNFTASRDWARDTAGHYDYTKQVVVLKWDAVNEASSYKIYRQREDESSPTIVTTLPETTYTITLTDSDDLVRDITYLVSAVVNDVEGAKASSTTFSPPPAPPW